MAARHRFLFLLAALALLASACGSSSNSSEEEATPQTAPPEAVGVAVAGQLLASGAESILGHEERM